MQSKPALQLIVLKQYFCLWQSQSSKLFVDSAHKKYYVDKYHQDFIKCLDICYFGNINSVFSSFSTQKKTLTPSSEGEREEDPSLLAKEQINIGELLKVVQQFPPEFPYKVDILILVYFTSSHLKTPIFPDNSSQLKILSHRSLGTRNCQI